MGIGPERGDGGNFILHCCIGVLVDGMQTILKALIYFWFYVLFLPRATAPFEDFDESHVFWALLITRENLTVGQVGLNLIILHLDLPPPSSWERGRQIAMKRGLLVDIFWRSQFSFCDCTFFPTPPSACLACFFCEC
jgi:hypothetical protein